MKGTCFNWWNQSALCKLRCHVFLTIGIWQWWLTYSLYLYTVFGSNDMASFLRWREGSVLFSNNLHVSRAACVDRNSWIAMMQKCNASELVLMGNDDNQKNEIKQFYTVYSRVSGSNECFKNSEIRSGESMVQKYISVNGSWMTIHITAKYPQS